MNYNKVIIAGRIVQEIELRYTPGGKAVCDISIAINRKTKHEGQEPTEDVTFCPVTLWGRTAEIVHQYAGKGQPLFVEGRIVQESWQDKTTGDKRSKLKIVADNIQLLGSKGEKPAQSNQHQQGGHPLPQAGPPSNPVRQQTETPAQEETEDIPF